MRNVSNVLCVALLGLLAGCEGACFAFNPRVDAGLGDEPLASISGTIGVGDAVGQAVVSTHERNVAREMLTAGTPSASHPHAKPTGRTTRPTPTSSVPFVPSELVVSFKPRAYDRVTLAQALTAMRSTPVFARAGLSDVDMRVTRCSGHLFCLMQLSDGNGKPLSETRTRAVEVALQSQKPDAVRTVSVNHITHGFRVPNDDEYPFQWHYQFINMEAAWDLEVGDPNLVIAIVDSGAVLAHPDLASRWARDPQNDTVVGMDFVSAGNDNDNVSGPDTNPEDPGDNLFGDRSSYHGTHIAGTIGAATDNNEGVAGITWAGKLLPVRVLGNQLQGSEFDLATGIYWAIGGDVDLTPANIAPARIVNLSVGVPADGESQQFWDDLFTEIYADADNQFDEPIFIAAVGNDDLDGQNIVPANVAGVITVGAIASVNGVRAPYSNFGTVVDIMAPGGDSTIDLTQDGRGDAVYSTYENGYGFEQGTSMSAPHVTGVVALLVSQTPSLTRIQAQDVLTASANPAGRCNEGCGAGWLDAFSALLLTGAEIEPVPRMAADANGLFFGDGVAARSFRVLNTGNVPFDFSVTVSGAQAELFSTDIDNGSVGAAGPEGEQRVVVTLARGTFEAGSANIELTSVGLNPEQRIVLDASFNDDPNRSPRLMESIEVGAYISRDGQLEKIKSSVATRAERFRYSVEGLAKGSYFVFAVADDNRDGVFDATTESVGAYGGTREPTVLSVGDDEAVAGIDFSITPRLITDIVGGVGVACDSDSDCTFAPDAICISEFDAGYCSRACDDGDCGGNGSCEVLSCAGVDCSYCLLRCANDAQCRFSEGYECDQFNTCAPASFNNP